MSRISGNYGSCTIGDCMNTRDGISTFDDDYFDLAIIDPPFNINFEKNVNEGTACNKKASKQGKIFYKDNMTPDEYEEWCMSWFNIMYRKAKRVVLYCGADVRNVKMWYEHTDPIDMIMYFMKFNAIITPSAWAGRYRPLLIHAKDKNEFLGRNGTYKFNTSVIVQRKKTRKEKAFEEKLHHPCPIDTGLILDVLEQLKPKRIIDPFMGSGTTAQCCEEIGIEWVGYELDEKGEYRSDIRSRIDLGIANHEGYVARSSRSQSSLDVFFNPSR